jgi:hypothetical protein
METSLKISRNSGYIQIDYVHGLPNSMSRSFSHIWFSTKKEAREFIKRLIEIELLVKEMVEKDNLPFDYRLVIINHLQAIDSISSGLDIRSNMSSEDLAERFVYGYNKRYEDAKKMCQDTLDFVESEGKAKSYMADWRRYDRHNELINEFILPVDKINSDDFEIDHIKNISEAMDRIAELLDERKLLRDK